MTDQPRLRPLRVAQLIPAMHSGGVERGTVEVARALVAAGHEAIVVSGGGAMVADLEAFGATHLEMPIGAKSISSIRWIGALKNWMDRDKIDVVHARSRVPAWLSYLAWRRLDARTRPHFVTTVHGLYSVNRYSAIMTRGERVIAVSRAVEKYIAQNYPGTDPKRVTLIPRGVDRQEFPYHYQPNAAWHAQWAADYGHLKECWLVTLPGRLTRLKGHFDFIELVAELKTRGIPVHGLIVGGERKAGDKFARSLRQAVEQRTLPVTFLGARADMPEIYAASDAIVSLSTSPESFGRTVLEALSVGTPVIGYAHGGVEEILNEIFPFGMVDPGNVRAASEKLIELYLHPRTVPAAHPFSIEQMLERTLALYQTLCAQPH